MKLLVLLVCLTPTIYSITLSPRIIGGGRVPYGEYPWKAALFLGEDRQGFCGGSLISRQYLITAGHCAAATDYVLVMLGSNKLYGLDPYRKFVPAIYIYVNSEFDENTLENDLGLIRLLQPVDLNDYVQPVPLPTTASAIQPGSIVTTLGWGQTTDNQVEDTVNDLQFVTLVALSNAECQPFFSSPINDESQICAAGNSIEGICFGDTGGSLTVIDSEGLPVIVAVSSFFGGAGCETPAPSGFARIFPHLSWINDTITEQVQ